MSSPTADAVLPDMASVGLAADDIQRRRYFLQRWRRRSAIVRLMRRLLPGLCLAILAGLTITAGVNTLLLRGAVGQHGQLAIHMLKPRFQGRNEKGQPYQLDADSAVRDDGDASLVTMENPVFVQGSTPQDQIHVRSNHGVYREDTRMLDLTGNVVLDDYQGNHFVTEHALVDTVKSNVDGDHYIEGHGPLGRIAASSYAVRDGGSYLFFKGKVKTRIEQRGAATAMGGGPKPAH